MIKPTKLNFAQSCWIYSVSENIEIDKGELINMVINEGLKFVAPFKERINKSLVMSSYGVLNLNSDV